MDEQELYYLSGIIPSTSKKWILQLIAFPPVWTKYQVDEYAQQNHLQVENIGHHQGNTILVLKTPSGVMVPPVKNVEVMKDGKKMIYSLFVLTPGIRY
jgi:hypothetical protein